MECSGCGDQDWNGCQTGGVCQSGRCNWCLSQEAWHLRRYQYPLSGTDTSSPVWTFFFSRFGSFSGWLKTHLLLFCRIDKTAAPVLAMERDIDIESSSDGFERVDVIGLDQFLCAPEARFKVASIREMLNNVTLQFYVKMNATLTVTETIVSGTKPFVVSGCTPSPFPYKICDEQGTAESPVVADPVVDEPEVTIAPEDPVFAVSITFQTPSLFIQNFRRLLQPNQFMRNQSLKNQFTRNRSLKNQFIKNRSPKNQFTRNRFLTNQSRRNQFPRNQSKRNQSPRNQSRRNPFPRNQSRRNQFLKKQSVRYQLIDLLFSNQVNVLFCRHQFPKRLWEEWLHFEYHREIGCVIKDSSNHRQPRWHQFIYSPERWGFIHSLYLSL